MKKNFTENQIIAILKSQNSDKSVEAICREHGIATATFYNWKNKYGGIESQELKTYARIRIRECSFKKIIG